MKTLASLRNDPKVIELIKSSRNFRYTLGEFERDGITGDAAVQAALDKEFAANIVNDWNPEFRSLVTTLKRRGFIIVSADNGEGKVTYGAVPFVRFCNEALATDECTLVVRHPKHTHNTSLYLILGNSPGEIVSDYTIPSTEVVAEELDEACDEHYTKWSDRPQPRRFARERVS